MTRGRPSLPGVLVALILLAGLAALSQLPWTAEPAGSALLRLSWRYQPEGDAGCRRPTPEELAELPVHMRNPDACVRDPVPYVVELRLDRRLVLAETLRAAGAREDRPVFVHRDVPIAAGPHAVDVRFATAPAPEDFPDAEAGLALSWSDSVTAEPREVIMIGYDRPTRSLVRLGAAADSIPRPPRRSGAP